MQNLLEQRNIVKINVCLPSPAEWTRVELEALPADRLDEIARRAAVSLTTARLLLGRCLLAIDNRDAQYLYGCNSAIHYAKLVLRIPEDEARKVRLVASRLEQLPILTEAAQNGRIGWSSLCCVLRAATPENEAEWLHKAQTLRMRVLERLVRRASPEQDEPQVTELRFLLGPDRVAMYHRALQILSQQAGKPLSALEAFDAMCAEVIAGAPFPGPAFATQFELDAAAEMEAPWAAVAAEEIPAPEQPDLALVRPATPHWQNGRLSWNPKARATTPAQQSELLRRDGYRCSTPGCPHKLWLEVHHVVFHCRGGATVPENLVVLCAACHKNIHRGWLRVTGDAPRGLQWTDCSGRNLERFREISPGDWLSLWVRGDPPD